MYLAHYDLVTTSTGRAELELSDLDPDLLRLSVGTSPSPTSSPPSTRRWVRSCPGIHANCTGIYSRDSRAKS